MQVERVSADHLVVQHTAELELVRDLLVIQQHPICFVVDEQGVFVGAITKGDLLKGEPLANESNGTLYSAGAICNRNPKRLQESKPDSVISRYFNERITCIPLLDNNGKLAALARPQSKNLRLNLNIGAGAQVFDGFINLDVKSDWYEQHHKEADSAQFVEYDILTDVLPYDENTVDNIYLSHVVEHISNDAVANLLADCVRVLKPTGVMRIACPDAEFLAHISSFQNDFWYWRRDWFRLHANHMDAKDITQFDFLVREVATERVGQVRAEDFAEDCLAPENRIATLEKLVEGLSFNKDHIGNHINYWTFDKLSKFAQSAGFTHIVRSKYQGCISQDMKGKEFDATRPEMSLYVDLVKS
ncbi:methyltransferase domain-containing protein [Paraneptunicella aestuarii]|uniref:methyltransferase domain-containing protein n=1 Tax=Paraneptunicella aestuarii TaxID=2831148 RepID=UPI001E30AF3A|nr:methyltransferase domain-containing protein [Paraneptunicella aestuarii]UAA39548.1 methyltransferase domain-containing protein [Paraneptunicella aestuarii]